MKKNVNEGSQPLAYMQRICSVREYCEHDIRLKLKRFDLSETETESIIAKLKADKFLDEDRYAAAFVRDKSRLGGWGSRKIVFALKNKRVADRVIDNALSQIDHETERGTLEKVLATKAKELRKEEDRDKLRSKLIRFALSRGFGYDKILEVLNKIIG